MLGLFDRFRDRLVDEASCFWHLWSIRLAAIASLLIGYVLSAPDVLVEVMNMMPSEVRALIPSGATLAIFALTAIVRLYKQKPAA